MPAFRCWKQPSNKDMQFSPSLIYKCCSYIFCYIRSFTKRQPSSKQNHNQEKLTHKTRMSAKHASLDLHVFLEKNAISFYLVSKKSPLPHSLTTNYVYWYGLSFICYFCCIMQHWELIKTKIKWPCFSICL